MSFSLFEQQGDTSIGTAIDWIGATVFGPASIVFCTIAIAFVGLTMLTGNLPVRRGLHVVVGCFVLFGAPLIATNLLSFRGLEAPSPPVEVKELDLSVGRDLPQPSRDPYAGASLRRE